MNRTAVKHLELTKLKYIISALYLEYPFMFLCPWPHLWVLQSEGISTSACNHPQILTWFLCLPMSSTQRTYNTSSLYMISCMIFMDCGSCVRVEVLAKPLSSEDSEQDGKDVSLRQFQQERICYSYCFYTQHRCKTSVPAWILFSTTSSGIQQSQSEHKGRRKSTAEILEEIKVCLLKI